MGAEPVQVKTVRTEESGTVPEEIKIVYKASVVESAEGVEPSVQIAGPAEALITSVECGEGTRDKHGHAVSDPGLEDVEEFFKVSFCLF